jgi:hypothetical protein
MKKWPADKRCADGVLAECYRQIRKGGRIKFCKQWWQDDRLIEFEGETVLLWPDYYITELTVFAGGDLGFTVYQEKP